MHRKPYLQTFFELVDESGNCAGGTHSLDGEPPPRSVLSSTLWQTPLLSGPVTACGARVRPQLLETPTDELS